MSGTGEREIAPEIEDVVDGEEHGADAADTDESDSDEVGEESDERDESDGEADLAGTDEGQAGRQDQVAGKPRSSATIAVQEAKRRAKAAEESAAEAKREVAELRAAQQGRQTEQQQNLERERLVLMSPEEKYEYLLNRQAEQTRQQVAGLQFQMQDGGDRIAFQSLAARNDDLGKAYSSVSDDVEQRLAEMRRTGQNAPRETIAKYLIGERAVQRLARSKPKQQAKGQQRIASQTTKPGASRGDVAGGGERRGGSDAANRKARLEDQNI